MADKTGTLIAGTILNQVLLIRILESKGVLAADDVTTALRGFLTEREQDTNPTDLYEPMRLLIRHLEDTDLEQTAPRH